MMLKTKKVILSAFFISMICSGSLLSMNEEKELDQQLRIAQKKADIARLEREAAENKQKAAQLTQQQQPKQSSLEKTANAPRPPSTATKPQVVAHNATTEGARGVLCLSNALKGKGWTWK